MNRAVFLDRDNTLIDNSGYLADPERVRLLPGAADAVARLRAAGYYVVVVTNQSGVARGLFTEEQLAAVHQRMQDLLRARGTGVDAVYYCPFLETEEAVVERYRRDSELRKPRPGMLLLAAEELRLDLRGSWLIGDAERDIAAGRAAGCRCVRIRPEAGEQTAAEKTAPDLRAAVDLILQEAPAPAVHAATTATPPPARAEPASRPPAAAPQSAEALLQHILDELRTARRETLQQEFSGARLAGAVAQAFAICMLGWGLYAAVDAGANNPDAWGNAVIRLLAAVAFQLIALTCFLAGTRR